MISKLMEASAQEADHKAFCDEEQSKSRKAKDDKAMKIDKYQARIDIAGTKKAELEDSIKELQDEVAAIDSATLEATNQRTKEKENYMKASKDFKASAEAVERAMA